MMQPIIEQILGQIQIQHEDNIMKTVQSVGINVNKERLMQALTDANAFYDEGYEDGYKAGKRDAVWAMTESWADEEADE